jgi:hypothetical protein
MAIPVKSNHNVLQALTMASTKVKKKQRIAWTVSLASMMLIFPQLIQFKAANKSALKFQSDDSSITNYHNNKYTLAQNLEQHLPTPQSQSLNIAPAIKINASAVSIASKTDAQSSIPVSCIGKEYPTSLLESAGLNASLLAESCQSLPAWRNYTALYGSKPVILGLERCAHYRDFLAMIKQPPVVRVAGMYNSGTNALSMILENNLEQLGEAFHHDVPWGKHVPAEFRQTNRFPLNNRLDPEVVLPLVIVREPLLWMRSMVRKLEEHDGAYLFLS